jgi:hypothetical protein
VGTGTKEVKYWARLGCWISLCLGPFSLGASFETYEPFISLIFHFFSGPGKLRIGGYGGTTKYYNRQISAVTNFRGKKLLKF